MKPASPVCARKIRRGNIMLKRACGATFVHRNHTDEIATPLSISGE
jgi:hypothetical protein